MGNLNPAEPWGDSPTISGFQQEQKNISKKGLANDTQTSHIGGEPINNPMKKQPLPKGKLNARFRQMRGVVQIFTGRRYLNGACGVDSDDAINQLRFLYDVPIGTKITIHSYKEPYIETL